MKSGTDNKKKTVAAIALAILALALMVYNFSGSSSTPSAAPQTAAPTNSQPAPAKQHTARNSRERYLTVVWTPTLDPRLRLDLLNDSEGVRYEGSGRNIFREHLEEIPKPVAPALTQMKQKEAWRPSGPPPPPPINLRFYGWATQTGGPKAVLLSQGDNVFVAHEGDVIVRRYKVLRINANSVEIRDVLSNNTQTIPLSQG